MGRGEGSARRRRERRLRAWWRLEQASVSAAVVSALHHSCDVGPVLHEALRGHKKTTEGEVDEHETHAGLRAQTAPPPGKRPGILPEPGPQRSDRTVRRSAEDSLPTPGLPVLAGASGEAVDSSALSFLVQLAVKERKREEEEKLAVKEKEKAEKELQQAKRLRKAMREAGFPHYPWLPSDDDPLVQHGDRRDSPLPSVLVFWGKEEKEKEVEEEDESFLLRPSSTCSPCTGRSRPYCLWFLR